MKELIHAIPNYAIYLFIGALVAAVVRAVVANLAYIDGSLSRRALVINRLKTLGIVVMIGLTALALGFFDKAPPADQAAASCQHREPASISTVAVVVACKRPS